MVMRKLGHVEVYQSGERLCRDIVETNVPIQMVAFWNIGQVGTVIKYPADAKGHSAIIAIDPYLTGSMVDDRPNTEFIREYMPPLKPEDLRICDAVFITHHHGDHMDVDTLVRLNQENDNVALVVPKPHVQSLMDEGIRRESLVPAYAGESLSIAGVDVTGIAASHTEYETDEQGNHMFLGYAFIVQPPEGGETLRIYHSGDTVITDDLIDTVAKIHPHVALLPINGEDYFRTKRNIIGNMSARSAIEFASAMGVDLVIPNHYDMFANNRDNPAHFVDYLFHEHPNLKFHMMSVGERFFYSPPTGD